MMLLNICEKQVRRVTNELVEKGYITKDIQGTSKNKLANKYTLIEDCDECGQKCPPYNDTQNMDKNVDKNVPLKNKKKINKNSINNNTNISNTDIDDTNTDNVSFNKKDNSDNIEVCDSAEQREDDKTNVIEYRDKKEMKKENITSTEVEDTLTTDDNNKVNTISTNVEDTNLTYEDYINSQRELYNEIMFGETVSVTATNTNDNFKVNNKKFQYHYDTMLVYIADWKRYHTSTSANEVYEQFGNIKLMYDNKRITDKQYQLALSNFKGFFTMEDNFKAQTNKSNDINTKSSAAPSTTIEYRNENKAVLSAFDASDDKLTISDNKTQQNANKSANWTYLESVCTRKNKSYDSTTANYVIKILNKMDISYNKKLKVIERYFEGMAHKIPEYLKVVKKDMINQINMN